jgi:signal transduction histidine kinase/ligand-binding sensor domain-containing protein
MRLKIHAITLLISLLALTHGFTQHPDLTFDHYNVEDGLSQSTVWSIFEDSKGFMWFCTPDGLNKFDGYSFKVYRNDRSDSGSIRNNHAVSIFEDSAGDLWIGHGAGLSKYLYGQDRFALVYSMPNASAEDDGLLPLHESGDTIWAWDRNRGIVGFNRSTLKEEKVHPLPPEYVLNLTAYSRFARTIGDKAFISTTSDLFIVFDFVTTRFTFLFTKPDEPGLDGTRATNKFTVDKSGNLWIPGNDGVISMDSRTLKTKVYKGLFNGKYLSSCTFDSNGMLWIGSYTDGLFILDPASTTVTNISRKIHSENGLLYNYIESLFTDSAGNIWIGTNGFGIQKFSKYKNKFEHFDLKIGTNVFGANLVKAIAEDERGRLYVGTFGNGLYAIDKDGTTANYVVPGTNNAINLVIAADGDVLFSNDRGLFTVRNSTIAPLQVADIKSAGNITCMLQAGHEVFFANEVGVHCIQNEGSGYVLKRTLPVSGRLPSVLYKDRHERLWIGTQRSFFMMDKSGTLIGPMDQVTNNFVKSFSEDDEGNLWIATLGDLIRYNPENGKTQSWNEKDGFLNTFFYAALQGNDQHIWISSNQGLASFDPKQGSIRNFTVLDGLQSNEFNTGAFCKLKDGRLAFGGLNGLNIFDPTAIRENPNIPKIAFTNFLVDDKPHDLDTAVVLIKRIDLPHTKNTLSFEFSALEFTSPGNNRYAYMLKGHDKEWVQGGNRRFVRYSRLAPGQYEFMVKASNSDNVWNDVPVSIAVNIHPPVYMRAWFIWSAALLLVLLIVLVSVWVVRIRYRVRLRRLEVDHKVQLERERISRDLHDHVGSQLTFIINQLDGGQKDLLMKGQLADARDAARVTMGNLRETIWALQREAITLVDFTDRVKEFAMKQLSSKPGMRLDFTEKLDTNYEINPSKALNLFRISQEVINNSIKHSEGTLLSINIDTSTMREETFLRLTIADNGKGFQQQQNGRDGHAHGNGLPNIRFRGGEINADLSITSAPGKGTSVMVSLAMQPLVR